MNEAVDLRREAALALEDGSIYVGEAFGALVPVGAEVVFNTTVPPGVAPFLEQLHRAGFRKRGGHLMCTYFEENILGLFPAEHVDGLYGCLDYYQSVADPFSRELLARYDKLYPGGAKFTGGSAATGMYRGLKLWEAAVREAGSLDQAAVIRALGALKRTVRGRIYTDSQYVRQGVLEWMPNWKARGWKTADKKPVKNQDLVKALHAEIARHDAVRWHWVKGHEVGDAHAHKALNDRADRLAVAADGRQPVALAAQRERLVLDHRPKPGEQLPLAGRRRLGQQDLERALVGVLGVLGRGGVASGGREHAGRVARDQRHRRP